jgi:ubiquinone/menaquinone biosynthesis C-methylase UbiE
MTDTLLQAFVKRPGRYALLDKGLEKVGFRDHQKALEIGCAYGDAVFHIANRYCCDITGVDRSEELIDYASSRGDKLFLGSHVEFKRDDAEELGLLDNGYDLIVSEAAFSPLDHKEMAVKNYYRVLKPDGRVLINDFAIQYKGYENVQPSLSFIPCFAGVKTMTDYVRIFENGRFKSLAVREDYGEFISLALFLSRNFGVAVRDLGSFFAAKCNENCEKSGADPEIAKAREAFFRKARLTYCQLIFEKESDR